MKFLNVLILASSAASASVVRRATPAGSSSTTTAAAVSDDIAAFFTGFSDTQCATVNTKKTPVTFSKHDGHCIKLANPAKSVKAVDAHPEASGDASTDDEGAWYFYVFTTDDCDVSLATNAASTAVPVNDDTCHPAAAGKTFKSVLMYSEGSTVDTADEEPPAGAVKRSIN